MARKKADKAETEVSAGEPVQAPAASQRQTKARTEPSNFGEIPTYDKSFKMEEALAAAKAEARETKKDEKGIMRRRILAVAKPFEYTLANYLTPREITALCMAVATGWPKDGIATQGYGTEPGRIVKNMDEVRVLAGERRLIWQQNEAKRAPSRNAAREQFGDLLKQYPGKGEENRRARLRLILNDKPWVVMDRDDDTKRAEGFQPPHGVPAGDRFYDIDALAGRGSYWVLRPEGDLKKDGVLAAKNSGKSLKMSPVVYNSLIVGDKEFEGLVKVPEGFLVATKAAPAAEGEATPAPRRRGGKKREDNSALLATANEDAGMPAEPEAPAEQPEVEEIAPLEEIPPVPADQDPERIPSEPIPVGAGVDDLEPLD